MTVKCFHAAQNVSCPSSHLAFGQEFFSYHNCFLNSIKTRSQPKHAAMAKFGSSLSTKESVALESGVHSLQLQQTNVCRQDQ